MEITRIFEFDSGHRIPNHTSQCKNMHGHRYKLELTLSGEVLTAPKQSYEGMVLDFADVKHIAKKFLDTLDHAFLVSKNDSELIAFLQKSGSKFVIIPTIPTVENLVIFIEEKLSALFRDTYNNSLTIKKITLWETPNCYATLER